MTKKLTILLFSISLITVIGWKLIAQSSSPVPNTLPSFPRSIPPPPVFPSLSSKTGKYQMVSAEYYSMDSKPFLWKRLVKFDTTTGEAWVLHSKMGTAGETRRWVQMVKE